MPSWSMRANTNEAPARLTKICRVNWKLAPTMSASPRIQTNADPSTRGFRPPVRNPDHPPRRDNQNDEKPCEKEV